VGNSVHDKESQLTYIHNRMDMLVKVLDTIDAESAGVSEIDRIIEMLDDIELKCQQFRKDWE
jgi:Mn-containing catalase